MSASLDRSTTAIRVMTINLWGTQGDWAERRQILSDGLQVLAPHIVTFQESIVMKDYDQVADITPPGYEVRHQSGRSPDGTGCSLASRLPLGDFTESSLRVTPRMDPSHGWIGSIATVEVDAPERIGRFLLAHLKPSWQQDHDEERDLQSAAAADFIEKALDDRDLPVVLAGDLDAPPDSASIRFWKGQAGLGGLTMRLTDAWEAIHPEDDGHTFTSRNPLVAGQGSGKEARRIDYILVKGLEVVDCFLAFDQPVREGWASDHFGVVADLGSS